LKESFGETPEVMNGLSKFNYVYGPNASGKTTLSRLVANPSSPVFSECELKWTSATNSRVDVYNHDFIARNFTASSDIKGIFTLGEKHEDTVKKIAEKSEEIRRATEKLDNATANLQGTDGAGGKLAELAALEAQIKETIWRQKSEHEERFKGPLRGFLNNKDNFKSKVLQERAKNSSTLLPLADLELKAATLFGSDPTEESIVGAVDGSALVYHESNPILRKRVIGKEVVDIAEMIKKLNNSDWVRTGNTYYDANGRICPFCQQITSKDFAHSLNEYFDETFLAGSNSIDALVTRHTTG
jgi:wobble nucleotide-excising tRNase